jgi:hypothetical protein
MEPSLAVHSDAGLVPNDWWEKTPLTVEELRKIKPFLDRIKVLKQQGLTRFGIIASYLHRPVRPLKAREHYGFEYAGAEDPSRMFPTQELIEEKVLECLCKILKGVSVVLLRVNEFTAKNPPLAVSLLLSYMYFSSLFSVHKLVNVDLGCLQEWGRNFDDMPPLPSENNSSRVGEGGN